MYFWTGFWGLWEWNVQHWRSVGGEITLSRVVPNMMWLLFHTCCSGNIYPLIVICLPFKLFSNWATTVKLDNHVLMHTERKSDNKSAFLSRFPRPVWSWLKTTRVNTFLWQSSANLKRRRTTKSWWWKNVAPTGNNWLATTGAASVTMEKAPFLQGGRAWIFSKSSDI